MPVKGLELLKHEQVPFLIVFHMANSTSQHLPHRLPKHSRILFKPHPPRQGLTLTKSTFFHSTSYWLLFKKTMDVFLLAGMDHGVINVTHIHFLRLNNSSAMHLK